MSGLYDPSKYWGKQDPDALFRGHPITSTPWPGARRSIRRHDYQKDLVHDALRREQELEPVDPREVSTLQDSVTYAGVKHYLHSDELYKDQHQVGNRNPVVYERDDEKILLSGNHRAAARLLQGQQFNAVLVKGGWGGPR